MKILVIGSRGITSLCDEAKRRITCLLSGDGAMLISGGARGVDSLAEALADRLSIPKLIIRPNYDKYGRSAPLVRDREMVERADYVLAVWDGESRGTKYTLDYAEKLGKPTEIIFQRK